MHKLSRQPVPGLNLFDFPHGERDFPCIGMAFLVPPLSVALQRSTQKVFNFGFGFQREGWKS